jgi:hypothetical protein
VHGKGLKTKSFAKESEFWVIGCCDLYGHVCLMHALPYLSKYPVLTHGSTLPTRMELDCANVGISTVKSLKKTSSEEFPEAADFFCRANPSARDRLNLNIGRRDEEIGSSSARLETLGYLSNELKWVPIMVSRKMQSPYDRSNVRRLRTQVARVPK